MSKPVLAFAVCLLALIAYANSLGNGFVWDDPIILSRQLPAFRSLAAVFAPPANIPQFAPDYYRPLVISSYLFDRAVAGEQPLWFHLTLVLAHLLTTLMVFGLGDLLLREGAGLSAEQGTRAAALGAALFAVHPVHTEAVAWIAGRADVFATLFGVTAVYAHLCSRRQPRFAWLAAAAWLLALFSKEVAISLVVLLPLVDVLLAAPPVQAPAAAPRSQRRRDSEPAAAPLRGWRQRYLPLAAALAIYAVLRLAAIGSGLSTTSGAAEGSLVGGLVAAAGVYAGKLVAPLELNAYIASLPVDAVGVTLGIASLALFAGAVALAWRQQVRPVLFLLLWIAATLAPAFSILLKIPEVPLAERYLYLPSVGFCLLAGWATARGLSSRSAAWRWASAAAAAVLLLSGTVLTIARNRVWASDLTLWTDTVVRSPQTGLPLRSLAGVYLQAGRVEEAERAYQQALERFNTASGRVTILTNLGTIALGRDQLERAEDLYRQAMALQPTADGFYNLGVLSLRRAQAASDDGERRRRADLAFGDLQRAESASPYDPDIQVALGQALGLLDRSEEARSRYRRALSLGLTGERAAQVRSLLARP